jgi:hypothetical protein
MLGHISMTCNQRSGQSQGCVTGVCHRGCHRGITGVCHRGCHREVSQGCVTGGAVDGGTLQCASDQLKADVHVVAQAVQKKALYGAALKISVMLNWPKRDACTEQVRLDFGFPMDNSATCIIC